MLELHGAEAVKALLVRVLEKVERVKEAQGGLSAKGVSERAGGGRGRAEYVDRRVIGARGGARGGVRVGETSLQP